LMVVAQEGFLEAVRALATKESCRDVDCMGRTALMLAAADGLPDVVAALLPHSDAQACDVCGESALMRAAHSVEAKSTPLGGHLDCARLLAPYSNVEANDGDGWTALMNAANARSLDMVRLLAPLCDVHRRIDMPGSTWDGLSAVDIARDASHANAGSALLAAGDWLSGYVESTRQRAEIGEAIGGERSSGGRGKKTSL
jgi:hypothetical protein